MCCVRPGVLLANASRFWLQRMLMAVDFPAFDRPAKATSGCGVGGKSRKWLTVVKKRAWWSRKDMEKTRWRGEWTSSGRPAHIGGRDELPCKGDAAPP